MSYPALYNPTIKQGTSFARRLIMTDAAGVAIDLTGATYLGDVRGTDGTIVASFTFTEDADPTLGQFTFEIDDTTTLPADTCLPVLPYDIFVTLVSGDVICPVEGLISVEAIQTDLTPVVVP